MKIRTQDARRFLDFGECHIENCNSGTGVYIKTRYNQEAILAGVYEDDARAKGVLYEIGLAHSGKTKVFYMPME